MEDRRRDELDMLDKRTRGVGQVMRRSLSERVDGDFLCVSFYVLVRLFNTAVPYQFNPFFGRFGKSWHCK
jgi:hypothetical protein